MKGLILCGLIVVLITSCNTKPKPTVQSPALDSAQGSKAVNVENTSDIQADLKVNASYYLALVNSYIYIIDAKYCYQDLKICNYSYDEKQKIVSIKYSGILQDHPDDVMYYQVESGTDVKNHGQEFGLSPATALVYFDLNKNLKNSSYALVQVDKISEGNYKVNLNSGNRINVFKPNNYPDLVTSYNYATMNLKQAVESFNQNLLTTENKVDVITNFGSEKVDANLLNKVDYSYNSLMNKWNKLHKDYDTISNFLASNQSMNSGADYLPKKFSELAEKFNAFKNLIDDNQNFNSLLDSEILPLIQNK